MRKAEKDLSVSAGGMVLPQRRRGRGGAARDGARPYRRFVKVDVNGVVGD